MDGKIKLLILTHTFPTKYNPTAAIFLLNQLKELKKYCDIRVIFPYAYVPKIKTFNPYHRFSKISSQEEIEGILVYHPKYLMFPRVLFKLKLLQFYLFVESFFSYFASKKLAKEIITKWEPHIIHLHGAVSEGLLGTYLTRKYKTPFLVTVYGEDITKYSKRIPSKYLTRLSLKNADTIICQSKFLENEIKGMGISNKKFCIIPMGVPINKFMPKNQNKARNMLNIPKDNQIVLFVGDLIKRKGVKYLITAMKIVLKKNKNVLCYIIGDGSLENELRKLSSKLNLNNNIRFLGEKKNNEIVDYMNACDILVLPSLNEGLPVVLCEALACGKPVVATRVAGTPELVTNDVGYLVKPKNVNDLTNKIILALNKEWDKKKMLKRAEEFSVANSTKQLMNVYENILRKN